MSKLGTKMDASLIKAARASVAKRAPHVRYDFKHFDKNGILLDEWTAKNLVTTAGGLWLLDSAFDAAAQITTWYLGLISSASYGAGPAVSDTMGSHAGWTECNATNAPNYSTPAGTDRGTIVFGEPSGTDPVQLVSSAVNFVFSGTGTVKGSLMADTISRTSTTGTLYSAAAFGADKVISSVGDQLNVTVTVEFNVG